MRELWALLIVVVASTVAVVHASEPASVEISVGWRGATAERMEQGVTTPLESQLKMLPRVLEIRSTTTDGMTKIKVTYPSEAQCSEVEAIAIILIRAQTALPSEASTPEITSGGAKCKRNG